MHARTFVVLAAAAIALAAYAGWVALDKTGADSRPPRGTAPVPDAAPGLEPKREFAPRPKLAPRPAPQPEPEPEAEPEAKPEPEPEPEAKPEPDPVEQLTPFDHSRELYHQAAETLRSDRSLDEAGTKALLEQATLAVKDMNALAEPDDDADKRDLQRATEDLARLQARYE